MTVHNVWFCFLSCPTCNIPIAFCLLIVLLLLQCFGLVLPVLHVSHLAFFFFVLLLYMCVCRTPKEDQHYADGTILLKIKLSIYLTSSSTDHMLICICIGFCTSFCYLNSTFMVLVQLYAVS